MPFVFSLRKILLHGEKCGRKVLGTDCLYQILNYVPLKEYFSFYSQSFPRGSVIGFSCCRQTEGTKNGRYVWETRVLMLDLRAGNYFFEYARPAFLQ